MGVPEIVLTVGTLIVGILATAGYGVLSLQPPEFQLSRRLFLGAAFGLGGIVVMWGATTTAPFATRVLIAGIFGAIAVAGTSEAVRWVAFREAANTSAALQERETQLTAERTRNQELKTLLEDRDRRKRIREALGTYLEQGRQLMARCGDEAKPAPEGDAQEWANATEKFLRDSLDESYVARFRSSAGLPLTANSISSVPHRNVWGALWSRTARLQEFIVEKVDRQSP